MRYLIAIALASIGCQPTDDTGVAADLPPRPATPEQPAEVRFHMTRQFKTLLQIQRKLLAGQLADAKVMGSFLAHPSADPGLAAWDRQADHVTTLANELAASPSVDEALRRTARVAVACAECHFSTQRPPKFPAAPPEPADEPSVAMRMARHRWAADRLWEGVVAGDDTRWRAGLAVVAAPPLAIGSPLQGPDLGGRVAALAKEAVAAHIDHRETLDERGRIYGEILVACAACHTTLHR